MLLEALQRRHWYQAASFHLKREVLRAFGVNAQPARRLHEARPPQHPTLDAQGEKVA
jgi:hypothetical protein